MLFDVATALGFKATLAKKDNKQTPSVLFDVTTALGFLAKLSRKDDKQTPSVLFGVATALGFLAKLSRKDDKSKPSNVFDTDSTLGFKGKLSATNKTKDVFDTAITIKATLSSAIGGLSNFVKKIKDKITEAVKAATKAKGGAITDSGREIDFARGGIIRGGVARYLSGVPHYAGGTTRAHGTVFVAGEAGPEIMGHLNGRTEILNKAQIAQAIYGAVVSGMAQAVNALGVYLANHITSCTNAITSTIGSVWSAGGLSGLSSIQYHSPVMATGSVLPYDVAAQIAKSGEDICNTLDANNEDLIQTIISVIGAQTTAIVTALRSSGQTRTTEGINVQQVINEINRQTLMFGASPLKGV